MGHEHIFRSLIHVPSKCLSLHTKGYYMFIYFYLLFYLFLQFLADT